MIDYHNRGKTATKRIAAFALVAMLPAFAAIPSGCMRCPSSTDDACSTSPELLKEVTLSEIDAHGLVQAIEKHRGRVVLVDFLATWCGPCVQLFPHTVELHRRYSRDDLAVITISLDKLNQRAAVLEFLRRHGATTENYQNAIESDSEAFDAYSISEGVPHTCIYNRAGKLVRTIDGNRPAEIDKGVLEAMGTGG
jgi:thiol-disulfide isomerase/thioredoxin